MLKPIAFSIVCTLFVPFIGCGGDDVTVGRSDQKLKGRADGGASGDGQTCSWDDSVGYDVQTGNTITTPAPNGPYKVGDNFKSLDGCNDCTCTTQGIACTDRACGNGQGSSPPQGCTAEAKICPDGTAVGRSGPNCEFAACP